MRPLLSLHGAFFVFLAWSAVTVAWSLDPQHTVGASLTYLQVLVLLMMMWDLFDTDDSIVAGLQAYVLGAYIAAASVIANFVTTPRPGSHVISGSRRSATRSTGSRSSSPSRRPPRCTWRPDRPRGSGPASGWW